MTNSMFQFMILIAFTNYGGDIIPPALVDWVGLANFKKILSLGQFAPTFLKIFSWNMLWAIMSTALNYFAGLGLALLLNKKYNYTYFITEKNGAIKL